MKTILIFLCLVVYSSAQINDTLKNEIKIQQTLLVSDEQNQKGNIAGTVIDVVTKTPIAGVRVEILGTDKFSITSKDGQYSILDVSKGFYQIKAIAKGYNSETQNNVAVENGIAQRVFFTLKMNSVDPPDFVPVDVQPQPLPGSNPAPKYPLIAKLEKVEGVIWIRLIVDEDGIVKKTEVLKKTFTKENVEINSTNASLSTKVATDSLTTTALDAASRWKFTPALLKGDPVKVWVSIPFKFKLDSPHKDEKKEKK